ncbi:MAG: endopeptidase La [Mycoplasmatota bacterium]|nr:endopeptidase La [Mycoplasmatota bacterium]
MTGEKLLVLIINDMVIFPNNEVRIEYDNTFDKQMINIIDKLESDLMLIVNPIEENLDIDVTNLPSYGTLGKLKFKMAVPNGKTRVVIEGLKRVEISNYQKEEKFYYANYKEIIETSKDSEKDYFNILLKSLEQYIEKVPYMSNAVITQLNKVTNLNELCDLAGAFLTLDYKKKKIYITIVDPIERCKQLIEDMNEDIKFIELEQQIEEQVERELTESQKEYFLREKIKLMQQELGEVNSKDDEVVKLKNRMNKLKCSPKIKERIKREIARYESINSNSPELGIVREYLDWMLNLPWNNCTKDNNDLIKVKNILDASHYALDDVKDRILEYLAVKQNTNSLRSPILCLVGPPGVGKTSLAQSIAKSLGRKTAKISVGGINDEAEIIGHRRTYVGANPGRIIQGIRKAGTSNPVFIIDEIDKMTKDIKGDPASSLLEVLDPEQNSKFSDHYIEEEFDLSKVLFIATANYIEQIPYELRDRLEIINVSSYTEYEKLDIAKRHLVPKELEEHGLTPLQVQISDEALLIIIRNYTKEAGVRELERMIATLFRKIVKKILLEKNMPFYDIDNKAIEEFLGKKKYLYTEKAEKNEIGVVNAMAYTIFGGDILPVEATLYKGKGDLTITGSIGEVMQESCHIALSYIKANMTKFGLDEAVFDNNDLHIHVPEGAVNKDGPSAGITITTALISLLSNQAVDKNIAMTGEITLRGRVLGIGGLKEKVIGAHRAGIKKIFIPEENKKDLDEIPTDVKDNIKFITVKNYKDIYKSLFKVGKKHGKR